MELLSYEDLLSPDLIEIPYVGHLKIPKLRDIWKNSYSNYEMLCSYLSIDLKKYLEIFGLTEKYNALDEKGKELNTLYNLIINNYEFREIYLHILSFFIDENIEFDNDKCVFVLYKNKTKVITVHNNEVACGFFTGLLKKLINIFNPKQENACEITEKEIVGIIDNSNFDIIRNYIMQINYMNTTSEKPVKYKNDRAKRIAEKLAKSTLKKSETENLTLGKMISKYCTDNKCGINILNVFNMTIYQFYDQWIQHNHIRQSNLQDLIYANSVSFSDSKSYDAQLWLK